MPKRISEEEFDQLMTEARAAYVRDIEAAGSDSAKVDLAAKRLSWAEEAARDAFSQRGGLYKFFDSIPLIGKPVTFILDNVDKGTEQHGRFWGLIRGLFVGLIIAVTLVALSEGAAFVFEIGRNWISIHATQPILARQREALADAQKGKPIKTDDVDNEPIGGSHTSPEVRPSNSPLPVARRGEPLKTDDVDNEPIGGGTPAPAPAENHSPPVGLTLSERTAFVSITEDQFANASKAETDGWFLRQMMNRAEMLVDTPTFVPKETFFQPAMSEGHLVLIKIASGDVGVPIKTKDGKLGLIPLQAVSENTDETTLQKILPEADYNRYVRKRP